MFSGQDALKEKKGAKQTVTAKAGTERRQRQLMSVRHKAHKDLMKHLRSETKDGDDVPAAESGPAKTVWDYDAKSSPGSVDMALFPQFTAMMLTGTTREEVFQGTLLVRKVLSVSTNPPYDEVAKPEIVTRLIELTMREDFPELQFEAAWALTNLAAGTTEHTMVVIQLGAVPPLVMLTQSKNVNCCDQACWALGNIAGESAECRNIVLNCGGLQAIAKVLSMPGQSIFVIRNATWAMSNMLRGRPAPDLSLTSDVVPLLASLLMCHDTQVIGDALWSLSYISDGNSTRVQCLLDAGVVQRVIELLQSDESEVRMPATRIIGNIAAGTDEQTQTIINAGALQYMHILLRSKRAIRKEACWTLSNIAAGKPFQIDALVNSTVFVPLLECVRASELDVKKEAVWTVANAAFCGTPEHVKYLISIGYVNALSDVLTVTDNKILIVCMEALQLFLQLGEEERKAGLVETNYVADQLLKNGAVDHIEKLQQHTSGDVYALSHSIIGTYFHDDEERHALDGDAGAMQDLFNAQDANGGNDGGNMGGMAQDGMIQL